MKGQSSIISSTKLCLEKGCMVDSYVVSPELDPIPPCQSHSSSHSSRNGDALHKSHRTEAHKKYGFFNMVAERNFKVRTHNLLRV